MTAIQDLVANPGQFLTNNLLRSLWTGSPQQPIRSIKLALKPFTATKLSTGAAIPVYDIEPLGQGEAIALRGTAGARNRDYLNAYFCPYGDDAMHSITVSNGADFMFTTNMDGCSFGVGSPTATGARRVAHVNLRSTAQSHAAQRGTLQVGGLSDIMVDPDRYMTSSRTPTANYGEVKATTIGIRDTGTGQWRFRYQQYRMVNFVTNQLEFIALKRVG